MVPPGEIATSTHEHLVQTTDAASQLPPHRGQDTPFSTVTETDSDPTGRLRRDVRRSFDPHGSTNVPHCAVRRTQAVRHCLASNGKVRS